MTKLLTLEQWCDENYAVSKPTLQTLQRWARNGNIYPPPEKHGKQYRVIPGAFYVNPKDVRLGRKIRESGIINDSPTEFMKKVINEREERKV
ncbi:excisionase [Erwinia rhapontici]|uniref:excisionase n=1 Tax=Erwinia rhapontici TaxID=55212 RepID=UPI003D369344